ncbi:MAG: Cys-tRNA(Pro) deacylase [Anaerolineae bacterium]|nr:Cys-tRNA(Pro) deacylase [Anaerolineae bacterium]
MAVKNNVTRMLDARGIAYEACELPNEKIGALEAAEYLGALPEEVFKTIVAITPDGSGKVLAMVAGSDEVDAKALGHTLSTKKVKITSQKEAERITGLRAGGISPLALLNKGFQVVLDDAASALAQIYISGGQWGLNIRISPQDLIALSGAQVAKITR